MALNNHYPSGHRGVPAEDPPDFDFDDPSTLDLFNDPKTLESIAEIEKQAVRSSSVPPTDHHAPSRLHADNHALVHAQPTNDKVSKAPPSSRIHHQLARPAAGRSGRFSNPTSVSSSRYPQAAVNDVSHSNNSPSNGPNYPPLKSERGAGTNPDIPAKYGTADAAMVNSSDRPHGMAPRPSSPRGSTSAQTVSSRRGEEIGRDVGDRSASRAEAQVHQPSPSFLPSIGQAKKTGDDDDFPDLDITVNDAGEYEVKDSRVNDVESVLALNEQRHQAGSRDRQASVPAQVQSSEQDKLSDLPTLRPTSTRRPLARSVSMGQSGFRLPGNASQEFQRSFRHTPQPQPPLHAQGNAAVGARTCTVAESTIRPGFGHQRRLSVHQIPTPAPSQIGNRSGFARTISGEQARRAAIVASLGDPLPGLSTQPHGDVSLSQIAGASTTVSNAPKAGMYIAYEVEKMRKELDKLAAERAAAEEKAKQAQNDIFAARGEAEHVRRRGQETERLYRLTETSLKEQIAELKETIRQQAADHAKKLESLQTEHAFKTHNILASAPRTRFSSTQQPRRSHDTPSRDGFEAFQTPFRTPSRPGRRPAPADDFTTPGLMLNRTKSKTTTSKAKGSEFLSLQNSFARPGTPPSAKRQKEQDESPSSSPLKSRISQKDADDVFMDLDVFDPEDADDAQRSLLLHILFTHVYHTTADQDASVPTTIYRLMHVRSGDPLTFAHICHDLFQIPGDLQLDSSDIARKVCASICEAAPDLAEQPEVAASVVDLLATLFWRVPAMRELYIDLSGLAALFANEQPDVSIALCGLIQSCVTRNETKLIADFFAKPAGITKLLTSEDANVSRMAILTVHSATGYPWIFPYLTAGADSTEPPLISALCKTLDNLKDAAMILRVLSIFSTLSASVQDAVTILSGNRYLTAAVMRLLYLETESAWGLENRQNEDSLAIIASALSLLHRLVFPSPISENDAARPGLDLGHRLQSYTSDKDLNTIRDAFITGLGRISYVPPVDQDWSESDIRAMQYLAQDLLEVVFEGPEGDAIYELYVETEWDDDEEANLVHEIQE